MDLIGALSRLGFNDQAKPTAEEVHEAWEKQAKSIGSCDEATSDGLSRARDRLLKYAEETAAKEKAMRERVEAMRVLTYDTSKPMDLRAAMRELDLKEDDVFDEEEIQAAWEKWIRRTIPRDPYSNERRLNRARDILLHHIKLPEYQEALRAKQALKAQQQEDAAQHAQQEEALKAQHAQHALQQAEDIEATRRKRRDRARSTEDAQIHREANIETEMARKAAEIDADIDRLRDAPDRSKRPRKNPVINDDRLSAEIERLRVELPAARLIAASKKASCPKAGKVHVRTLDNKEKAGLLLEMERVFAERFEVNQDGKVLAKDLLGIFEKSTTNPGFNQNDFTYHSRNIFLKIWPQAVCKTFRRNRCFTGVNCISLV
jgi:hypothetical protein